MSHCTEINKDVREKAECLPVMLHIVITVRIPWNMQLCQIGNDFSGALALRCQDYFSKVSISDMKWQKFVFSFVYGAECIDFYIN